MGREKLMGPGVRGATSAQARPAWPRPTILGARGFVPGEATAVLALARTCRGPALARPQASDCFDCDRAKPDIATLGGLAHKLARLGDVVEGMGLEWLRPGRARRDLCCASSDMGQVGAGVLDGAGDRAGSAFVWGGLLAPTREGCATAQALPCARLMRRSGWMPHRYQHRHRRARPGLGGPAGSARAPAAAMAVILVTGASHEPRCGRRAGTGALRLRGDTKLTAPARTGQARWPNVSRNRSDCIAHVRTMRHTHPSQGALDAS